MDRHHITITLPDPRDPRAEMERELRDQERASTRLLNARLEQLDRTSRRPPMPLTFDI